MKWKNLDFFFRIEVFVFRDNMFIALRTRITNPRYRLSAVKDVLA